MASSLLNGERAVVLLFIAPILHATPLSLLPEALSLSLLALFALVIEVFADSSPNSQLAQFKTRRGASSGILLGAVTLPCLMISRLIQLLRALSLHEIGVQDLEYLRLQYWATFACGFNVLGFLGYRLWQLPNNIQPISVRTTWDVKFIFSCLALCGTVYCVLFATKYHIGWSAALKLLWVLSQGLATVKLIQHVVHNFPFCASIGEALLVTGGLVIYFGDMFALTFAKIHGYLSQSELTYVQYGIKRSEISIIIQGMVLGLLLFPIFLKLILPIWECFTTSEYSNGRAYHEIGKSVMFYASLASVLIVIVPLWMQIVQTFHVHPLLWVIDFIVSEPFKRLSLCIYWVAVILVSVRRFYNISKNSKIERILLRKYYHLMAVLMFLPALIFQPKFLDLAFGAALAVFLVLEIIRVWRIWPLGQLVHQFMNAFTDHRDSDLLIVSHFSLLLGCALPIWMSSGFNDRPLAPFAGILSLGIGDTMASMVGHKYGVLRWSKTGKKTVEGTAAGITSVLVACSVLLPLLATTGYIFTQHWFSLLLAVTVSGLLEAYTAQLDNAFIPLVFYSLLCL
ncbi:dolichol kinase EVAN isoform X1 [Rhododendron vialii]|uniref:dolichol kinase EVAN isoform X1 n=1 Tax=Rhododendron vialii TaxID=182163 RepID=UPI00265EE6FB|nr:dolichol kinase EVAN isoform X1 [Rhododendron vialii]